MLNVFFTVDVEVWCDGWIDIDRKFADAFEKYILGPTARGAYGLPFQLDLLNEYGLLGVFFVEPLFSTRFGKGALDEIVGLILEKGHEVHLHLHPEWVDESIPPLLPNSALKRPYLFQYSLEEQTELIATGAALLKASGATEIAAFRAGSFAFNIETLRALSQNGLAIDCSYNATMFGLRSGLMPKRLVVEPVGFEDVVEYPMTVFRDGIGKLRHAQLTACSSEEMESLLWQALAEGRQAFIILLHNFELLTPSKRAPDRITVARLKRLCAFLARNRDSFRVVGFKGIRPGVVAVQPQPLTAGFRQFTKRIGEQIYRRISR